MTDPLMFIVILTYQKPLAEVDVHIDAHMAWLEEQYACGIFLLSGPRVPREGGFIIAHGIGRAELDDVLDRDPFKIAGVAAYQVTEVVPSTTAAPLSWLKA